MTEQEKLVEKDFLYVQLSLPSRPLCRISGPDDSKHADLWGEKLLKQPKGKLPNNLMKILTGPNQPDDKGVINFFRLFIRPLKGEMEVIVKGYNGHSDYYYSIDEKTSYRSVIENIGIYGCEQNRKTKHDKSINLCHFPLWRFAIPYGPYEETASFILVYRIGNNFHEDYHKDPIFVYKKVLFACIEIVWKQDLFSNILGRLPLNNKR